MNDHSHQHDHSSGAAPASPEAPQTQSATMPILGMHCASCVSTVEGALKKAPGVKEATVNLATHTAHVSFDPAATSPQALGRAVESTGYRAIVVDEHSQHSAEDMHAAHLNLEEGALRLRLWVAVILGLPVGVLGMAHLFGDAAAEALMFPGRQYFELFATAVVVFFSGAGFHSAMLRSTLRGQANMDTLISIGTLAAFIYSAAVVLWPGFFLSEHVGHLPGVYFEVAAMVTILVLLGRFMEARARGRASQALKRLLGLQAKTATVLKDGREEEVPVEQLQPGDTVLLRPGAKVPLDGTVLEGASSIDESMLSGESLPVDKSPGSPVFAGTVNSAQGSLKYSVTKTGKDTLLAGIIRMVETAQGSKAPVQRLADQISAIFVPVVFVIAIITFVVWYFFGTSGESVERLAAAFVPAVAVLIIACPCALGLATPTAVLVASGRGAELGVLFRNGAALETAARIDTVVFDKTGTLTSGQPELLSLRPLGSLSEDELLRWAASAESHSEHPLARAVVRAAGARSLQLSEPGAFESFSGLGIIAAVEGKVLQIGSLRFQRSQALQLSEEQWATLEQAGSELASAGQTPLFVVLDDQPVGLLGLADTPRRGAAEAVSTLRAMGIRVMLLSGDKREVAQAIAAQLGILDSADPATAADTVMAEVLPADKSAQIQRLQAAGRKVAMVGDGVNDAPALVQAELGIAMGAGTDIAIESSDVTLVKSDPRDVASALALARSTMQVIRQNLFFAFIYNVLGIPVAAGALYPFTGWLLSPVIAGAAMAASSLSVVTNSLRLRR
ncbi:copper-translocating P-type ATPase [bacterium]|nr:copper-translocating P-type ATPase [bacterium]